MYRMEDRVFSTLLKLSSKSFNEIHNFVHLDRGADNEVYPIATASDSSNVSLVSCG